MFLDSHLQSIIERIPSASRETGFWFSMIHSRDHWNGFALFYFMVFYGEHIIDSTNEIRLMRCSIIGNTIAPMKDKRERNEAITQGGEEKLSKLKLQCMALFNSVYEIFSLLWVS